MICRYIAFFRGINVGGNNIVPMKALTACLEQDRGLLDVKTYIQSGNVVFGSESADTEMLADGIQRAVKKHFGFLPKVMVLSAVALESAINNNPFPEAEAEPKSLHLFFLATAATHPDSEKLNDLKGPSERFELIDNVFYLHAPDGIGRSKLAARAENAIGVPVTARNWRTVTKVMQLIESITT